MSYTKLFELHSIGLNAENIGLLLAKFNAIGFKSIITYNEILKTIRQKTLIDKTIDFLVTNKIIARLDDTDYGKFCYKILVEFPQTSAEKEAKTYLDNKLFYSQKELLIKKLTSYASNKKDGWIVFVDLANSTDNYEGDLNLLDRIMNKSFPDLVKEAEESFFSNTTGYLIKQQGDEAFLYFFEKEIALAFIDAFIELYKQNIFNEIENYNKSRNIKNNFQDKMYLKVFIAHSTTTQPLYYEMNKMPDFNNMSAFTFIKRSEKSFKEKMIRNGQKKVNTHFIVSMDQFNESQELQLGTQDGKQIVYYHID